LLRVAKRGGFLLERLRVVTQIHTRYTSALPNHFTPETT
jgi:hypothetical protein